jgi:hypothetical protein
MTGIQKRNTRFVAAASILCFALGVALSHRIEPGVRVEKILLTTNTPALRIFPTTPGPHPIALLAHGNGGSKEMLFRFGEVGGAALLAAGAALRSCRGSSASIRRRAAAECGGHPLGKARPCTPHRTAKCCGAKPSHVGLLERASRWRPLRHHRPQRGKLA